MSERKWESIEVRFDDGHSIRVNRRDFEQMELISPVLTALEDVKQMQRSVNALLGEAEAEG